MNKRIAIIVLHYGRKENTIACLESLENLHVGGQQLDVIVVDNGSTDEELRINKQSLRPDGLDKGLMIKDLKLIKNEKNLGYAGGNNVGITYALKNNAEYVLILNNDTVVDKSLITELVNVMEEDETVGIVGPKIYFAKSYEFHKDRYKENEKGRVIWYAGGVMDWANILGHHRGVDEVDQGQYDKLGETDYASGCCMFIKREVLEKVGFFDEKYFLYYEDADLSERTKRDGYKIVYSPKAMLWHKNAGSAGGSGSPLQDYYITRNRMLFAMRYAALRSKIAIVQESLKLLVNGRLWQKRGIRDFYLGKFGKGSYNA